MRRHPRVHVTSQILWCDDMHTGMSFRTRSRNTVSPRALEGEVAAVMDAAPSVAATPAVADAAATAAAAAPAAAGSSPFDFIADALEMLLKVWDKPHARVSSHIARHGHSLLHCAPLLTQLISAVTCHIWDTMRLYRPRADARSLTHNAGHRCGAGGGTCALLLWFCHHCPDPHGQAGHLPAHAEAGKHTYSREGRGQAVVGVRTGSNGRATTTSAEGGITLRPPRSGWQHSASRPRPASPNDPPL